MFPRMLSKNLIYSLLCCGLLSWSGAAGAQVYKSYDADGNVVFSDKQTKGSREVELTRPNLSDSFAIPPASSAASPLETESEAGTAPEPVTESTAHDDSADTNNDGRVSRREKQEQRKERHRKNREKAKAAEEN
jgi:hypothetical protein